MAAGFFCVKSDRLSEQMFVPTGRETNVNRRRPENPNKVVIEQQFIELPCGFPCPGEKRFLYDPGGFMVTKLSRPVAGTGFALSSGLPSVPRIAGIIKIGRTT